MPELARNGLLSGENAAILLLTLTALVGFLLLGWLLLLLRVGKLSRRLSELTRGHTGQNLEQTLIAHLAHIEQTVRRMESLEQAVAVLQAQLPFCLQQVNLVRYDAFEDVGGEQSFSLALLNAQGDGVVVSSVYSRMDVRVYAKAVQNGQASHTLSREEERALREIAAR